MPYGRPLDLGYSCPLDVLKIFFAIFLVLSKGGFTFKGLAFSGNDSPSDLSSDPSFRVAGMKWFSKEEKISLDTGDPNFAQKQR